MQHATIGLGRMGANVVRCAVDVGTIGGVWALKHGYAMRIEKPDLSTRPRSPRHRGTPATQQRHRVMAAGPHRGHASERSPTYELCRQGLRRPLDDQGGFDRAL